MKEQYYCCMVMRINIDCKGCCKKVQEAIRTIREVETHMIEQKQRKVMVCGKFAPQDVAISIRKKTNRRVEILEVQQLMSPNTTTTTTTYHPYNNNYQAPIIQYYK